MSEADQPTCLTIILAAGEGTRMRSALPKVLHRVAGLPMLGHVLAAADAGKRSVVIGPDAGEVRTFLDKAAPDAAIHEQRERLGTAHAVLAAEADLAAGADHVLVAYGDTPLVRAETLRRLRSALAEGADVAVFGFRTATPFGYGRLVTEGGRLVRIVEEKDASEAERKIDFVNGGLMALRGASALKLLKSIGNDNAKREYYLTDAVGLAHKAGLKAVAVEGDAAEAIGVNTRAELAAAEALWQQRARERFLAGGVTMAAPDTVYFSHDTAIGPDTAIEPNVYFGPGVSIGPRVTIRAFSHIEEARVAEGAIIGPFARLRPGADIARNAHVGNFVEIKAALLGEGAKVNHLTYIGDASIGPRTNIGAGTITCNYDGFGKHRTEIGADAFIGSNSALVAPVRIGDGAYIGSGSVITRDVAGDALALGRGQQVEKPGWAKRFREAMKVRRKPS
jgi:bifunctional UDP-N-acetylglucosamine pyrophosphorylase/glucosamine-1-phosphate N-acetyltransferase